MYLFRISILNRTNKETKTITLLYEAIRSLPPRDRLALDDDLNRFHKFKKKK